MRRSAAARKEGLKVQIDLDYRVVRSRMAATVNRLASGIKTLLESNSIDLLNGEAHIVSGNQVMVNRETKETRNIVIATGSYPVCLPGYRFEKNILSTDTILELEKIPDSLVIVGGGYSGCEFSAILNSFGCKVSLVEAQNHLLPLQIEEIGKSIEKYMRLDGINVITGSSVEKILDNGVVVNGKIIESEKVLVCVGRRPSMNDSELDKAGVRFDDSGIQVDSQMRTTAQNIFAIGDVTGLFELAHVASRQGEVAAQNIMGQESEMDYRTVSACVFTYPEVAFVGDLKGRSGEFPLAASPKANCLGDTRGVFKVFEENGIVVGGLIIAPHAGELIAEVALAIRMRMKPKDIFETIHAHPTLPESLVDATRDLEGSAIHIPRAGKKTNQ